MQDKMAYEGRFHNSFLILCLAVIVFIAYWPSLFNGFVNWDDDSYIFLNPYLTPLDTNNLKNIFESTVNKTYSPLTVLTWAIEYHFFKDNPFIYHLNNLILHILNVILIYALGRVWGFAKVVSFGAALIFGLHPIHVESVAWITERKDVLYAFFYLAACLFYTLYVVNLSKEKHKRWLYFGLVVTFAYLSVLSKAMALSLPLVLFLIDWWFRRKINLYCVLEKVLIATLYYPVIFKTYRFHVDVPQGPVSESVLAWIWCFMFYLKKFFLLGQNYLIYALPFPVDITHWPYFLSFVFFVALLIFMIVKRNRLFIFCMLFYFLSIFFILRFNAHNDFNVVADRFMYLPSLGFCLFLAHIFYRMSEKEKLKPVLIVFIIAMFSYLSLRTTMQTFVWKDGVSLWSHQLKSKKVVAPAFVYNRLANAYLSDRQIPDKQREENILSFVEKSLAIRPDFSEAYLTRGTFLVQSKNYSAAKEDLEKAIKFDSASLDAYFQLGEIARAQGDKKQMLANYSSAYFKFPENRWILDKIVVSLNEELNKDPYNENLLQFKNKILSAHKEAIRN